MSYSTQPISANLTVPQYAISKSKNFPTAKHFVSLLQNCKHIAQIRSIHAQIIRHNHDQNPLVIFELIRICSNFNSIDYAIQIFSYTRNPNVYIYTALIDGLVLSGFCIDGILLYYQMINSTIFPDNYVVTSVLKACCAQLALREGREIHCQVLKLGFSSNRSVIMKLMELYGKCGAMDDARKLFDEMPQRDVAASTVMLNSYFDNQMIQEAIDTFNSIKTKDTVCWTAMIDGLIRNGELNRALETFREMQRVEVRPNEVTIVCLLSACSQLGTLELGRWVHSYIEKYKIKLNHFLGGALINMYSRCGDIDEAWRIFNAMNKRNAITYNSMITGFALHGKSTLAIELFKRMQIEGFEPTSATFVGVLNACSHSGLADLGFKIFHSMAKDYKIEPQIEHYGCIVDLFGRLGRLEEAYEFIRTMKIPPDHIMLGALLSACKIHGNLELGEKVASFLMDCKNADSGTYIMLSNVYSSLGKWKEAAKVRAKMREEGIEKEPGCSSIEVNNEIHEFFAGDNNHPEKERIYGKLEEMNKRLRLEGYIPATEEVLHDIEKSEKEWALAIHSERLAICYGLISTKPNSTIRVVKNLRVCNDCHLMIKLISKITGRKLVVRDRNRFHHFEDGACSCGDFW